MLLPTRKTHRDLMHPAPALRRKTAEAVSDVL
jgi:hypothetical protein